MSKVEVDHNLLFGLLALQTGLIDQGALFTAFNVWTREKTRSMAEILVDQGNLDAPRRTLLEGLVAVHLKMHGDDPEKSLAAIEAGRSTRDRLAQIDDPELAASVALIGSSHQPVEIPRDQSRPTTLTPSSSGPPSDRQEKLLAEQHGRWAQGQRVLVEAFLERDPDLRDDPDALLDLIYNEVALCEKRGEAPEPDEYIRRFPELKEAIRNQFEIHRMFAGQGTESGSGDADRSSTFSVGTSSSRGLRFRVLRPHRSGGLGAVFVALDTELHREVALKQILDQHADDPVSRSRFLIEAEITGGLEHPGIVPVYGLGSYANGRPFYAMRFIRGDSLKDAITAFHADESLKRDPGRRSLELRKLLRRFLDVCNAIEYAHSRGVLHRDLKPGNIIVGKHGETLVVDWGLAKAVGRFDPGAASEERTLVPPSASGSAETLPGSALGTPAFMSPEQAAGDLARLGPRSDVYSLGATLYVLLTGRPPFEGNDVGAVLEAVWRGEFPRPRKLDPSIDRALEALCLKAMERSPEDRFGSPRAFADDIERWMADEPVTAWREPFTDRARRWARRHRTLVSTAAAVLGLSLIGLFAFAAVVGDKNRRLVGANRATKQAETLADARLDRAMSSIEDYFTGFSEDALKGGQLPPVLRDRLLAKPRQFYEQLAAELAAKSNPSEREQALLAKGQNSLGRILSILGKNEAARTQGEAAIATYEALVARHPEVLNYQDGLANSHNNLGIVLDHMGRSDEAARAYKKAITIGEALAARRPDVPGYQNGLAWSHNNLGVVLAATGRSDQAAGAYQKAITIYEALVARQPDVPEYQNGLATGHVTLGIVLAATGRSDQAAGAYKRAITIYEALVARQPEVLNYQNGLACSHNNLGGVLAATGRSDAAAGAYKKAVTIYEALVARHPEVLNYRNGLAGSHNNLGAVLAATGRSDQAAAAYKKAITIGEALAARYPDLPEYQSQRANSHVGLGIVLADKGRLDEAAAAYKKAATIYEALAARHPDVPGYQNGLAWSHNNLGNILAAMGRRDEAAGVYKRAVPIREALVARQPDVPEYQNGLAASLKNFGILLKAQGSFVDALTAFHRAAKFARPGTPAAAELPGLIRETENAIALANRLPALLKGDDKPKDAAEGLAFAQLCYDQSRYAAAARLWESALAANPKLADDRQTGHRYNAACAAALAAAGKGKDEPAIDDAKAKLRVQARDGLKAELVAWTKVLETGPAQTKAAVVHTLQHWQEDRDLAGIRDPEALEKLPDGERKDWRDLWAEVRALLGKARGEHP